MKILPLQVRLLPIFRELPQASFERLSGSCQWVNLARGDTLCNKGDPSNNLFVLVQGELQVFRVSREGQEIGLNLLKGPAVFGELGVIDGVPRSADIVALSSSQVALVPRRVLLEVFTESAQSASAMFRHLTAMVRNASQLQSVLSMPSASQRISAMLLQLANLQMDAQAEPFGLPKQRDLALMVNTTRETVSRTLRVLMDQGLISKSKGLWRVSDVEGLRREAGLD
jgi:CRP/FNR family cyclic AMP-dependent transcriptional regulator